MLHCNMWWALSFGNTLALTSRIALAKRLFLPTTLLAMPSAAAMTSQSVRLTSIPRPPSTSLSAVLRGLQKGEVFLLDGGTGEELFRRGVPHDRKIWSARAIVDDEYHSTVQEVHTSFMEAGSQAVTTNSYGISPGVGFTDPVERHDLVATSGRLARESVTHFIASKKSQQDEPQQDDQSDCFVLGSLGPLSESYRADLILPHDQAIQDYQVAIKALRPNVDAIIAETMSCVTESIQVLDSLATLVQQDSSFTELPLLVSYTLDSSGKFRDGQSVCEGLHEVLAAAGKKQLHVLAILFNCSEPEAITTALCQIAQDSALVKLLEARSIRLGAYANRLTAVDPNWTMESSGAPQPFRSDLDEAHYWKDFVQPWIQDLNVQLVGGCCGITPEHIAYIRYELQSH